MEVVATKVVIASRYELLFRGRLSSFPRIADLTILSQCFAVANVDYQHTKSYPADSVAESLNYGFITTEGDVLSSML